MNQRRRRKNKKSPTGQRNGTLTSPRNDDASIERGASATLTSDYFYSQQTLKESANLEKRDGFNNSLEMKEDDVLEFSYHTCTSLENKFPIAKEDIMSLPDDVLFIIFGYLNEKDLCRLCRVCKRFNYLSSKDCVWSYLAEQTVLLQFPDTRGSSSFKEKFRIAPNWKEGLYKDHFIAKHKVRLIPWIQKDGQSIWFSSGDTIRYLRSQPDVFYFKEDRRKTLRGMQNDVTRFVVKKDLIVAGGSDGSIHGWRRSGESLFHLDKVNQGDTHCVDLTEDFVVSGSKDGLCKVFPLSTDGQRSRWVRSLDAGERVWCLKCSPCQRLFVAGLAGCQHHPPLIKYDIESGKCLGHLRAKSKHGAGVLDMKFESPNELLTCGYDTFIRLWDLRTDTCVTQWEEPYDSSLYCLETDGANAMVVGTARHGMVRLWDRRKEKPVQMFYSTVCSGPVYSVAMDYGHLYLALDMGLSVMDFTGQASSTGHSGHQFT